MTIEVIRRGQVPGDKTYEVECRTCQSLLKFAQRDAQMVFDQRDGDFLVITCPVCTDNVRTSV